MNETGLVSGYATLLSFNTTVLRYTIAQQSFCPFSINRASCSQSTGNPNITHQHHTMDSFLTFNISSESSSTHILSEPENFALGASIPTNEQQLSDGSYDAGSGNGPGGGCVIA
jgi:hypothetical protein